jgi:two-component system cell cycle response regulator
MTGPDFDELDDEATRVLDIPSETMKIRRELACSTTPVLIVIRGTIQGKKYPLEGRNIFVLGRDTTADIRFDDANVSRQHLEISLEGEQAFITDLKSRNGTFLNDERVGGDRVELGKEDMIKLGSTILKYLPAGEFETLYHVNITDAAHMDRLTGASSHKYISEVLDVEFKRAKALGSEMSIVFFDIDDFKTINDTYGHDCGDRVLTAVGDALKRCGLGERDMAGRYGGDEFMVVLTSSGVEAAAAVAEDIRRTIENVECIHQGTRVPVTVSVGVSTVRKGMHRAADLYREADQALYESKRTGRNRVTIAPAR